MKIFRLVFIGASALVLLVLVALGVAFNSSFQTWAARRAVSDQTEHKTTIGSVSAGMRRVELKDLRYEKDGMVLTVPALEAELSVLAAGLSEDVFVSSLVAKGWTLDLSKYGATEAAIATPAPAAGGSGGSGAVVPPASGNPAPPVPLPLNQQVSEAFAGVFSQLHLPVDFSLDGVRLEGEVILPSFQGRAKVTLTGGGLGAGREGKLDLAADATLSDKDVSALTIRGTLGAAMDTTRTFTRIVAELDAAATGAAFPNGVKLSAALSADRAAAGESYALTVTGGDRPLLTARGNFPQSARQLTGTWKLDVRDTDLKPFALGQALPVFTASGEGQFDADATFSAVRASGRLDATADQLAAVLPELAAVGAVKIAADFDVAQRSGAIAVERLTVALAGARPVLEVRALQAFTFHPSTRRLDAADPARELLALNLQGVPLAWIQPFAPGTTLAGSDVRGEFAASARAGGLTLRSKTPLEIADLSATQDGKPLLRNVAVALEASGDYAPQAWQADIASLAVKSGLTTLVSLSAKAGQLLGKDEPIKATGKLTADLPALLAQPAVGGVLALVKGDATVDFVASFNAKHEIQARVALNNLAVDPRVSAEVLPSLSTELRADIAPSGQITLNAPISIVRDGRTSDLVVAGTLAPGKDTLAIDAQVTSNHFVVEDAKILSAAVTPSVAPSPDAPPPERDTTPPWAGLRGSLALALKKVVYSDTFQVSDLHGTLRIEEGVLRLGKVEAGVGEGGGLAVEGAVTFDAAAPKPYALSGQLALREFDPGPLFRALNPAQPATVEGKFDLASKVGGRAATFDELLAGANGEFQLTSKGGHFRGLPVSFANKAESVGYIAAGVAKLGSLASSLTSKSERLADITNRAQAVSEFTRGLNPIAYDQLSVVLVRDEALNTTLRDFTLISPELRLTGSGQTRHQPGKPLLEDALTMEFKLRARGHQGDLLKYLGLLETQADDLGYASSTLPLKVSGTLGKPDTTELNAQLAALALEKTGVTDMFKNLMGGGK